MRKTPSSGSAERVMGNHDHAPTHAFAVIGTFAFDDAHR